jgi:hypothetical protein
MTQDGDINNMKAFIQIFLALIFKTIIATVVRMGTTLYF